MSSTLSNERSTSTVVQCLTPGADALSSTIRSVPAIFSPSEVNCSPEGTAKLSKPQADRRDPLFVPRPLSGAVWHRQFKKACWPHIPPRKKYLPSFLTSSVLVMSADEPISAARSDRKSTRLNSSH